MCWRCDELLGLPLLLWLIFSLWASVSSLHYLLNFAISCSGASLPAPIINIVRAAKKGRKVEFFSAVPVKMSDAQPLVCPVFTAPPCWKTPTYNFVFSRLLSFLTLYILYWMRCIWDIIMYWNICRFKKYLYLCSTIERILLEFSFNRHLPLMDVCFFKKNTMIILPRGGTVA